MMASTPAVIQVAVPVPLRRIFDYEWDHKLTPGVLVVVPFGRRNLVGVVVSANLPEDSARKLKRINQVRDGKPVFSPSVLELLIWAAGYYHHPIGEVLSAALPVALRSPKGTNPPSGTRYYSAEIKEDVSERLRRSPSQTKLYQFISQHQQLSEDQCKHHKGWRQALAGLVSKELVTVRTAYQSNITVNATEITLTPAQSTAANALINNQEKFAAFLLQGITGSGKTEVYLAAARHCIDQEKQVLFLVPEISLTPQLVNRVSEQLGEQVFTLHSGMTNRARYETWWMAREGHAKVVLGTRSAIFCPLSTIGLIIVDEEHDQSYKQQDGFRYHARNLAIKRASQHDIPIVLGSATPSLESLHNVSKGRYQRLILDQRIGEARLPQISTVDLGIHPPLNGLTDPVYQAIDKCLSRNEQVIVYVNRRGYAPVVNCYQCQWQATCERCDARLTYHQTRNQLRCHHCGYTRAGQENCPECDMPLYFAGAGTQRIEQALLGKFPNARLTRLDRDEANTANKLYQQLEAIRAHQVDIVIGTQLITKGHDFSNVSLVCVVNADQGLFSIDFRAPELMFQQLVQVAGRAGRASNDGQVLIQTGFPGHPYIQMIKQHDYQGFATAALTERAQAGYPPTGHIVLFRAESNNATAAIKFLRQTELIGKQLLSNGEYGSVEVLSAVNSPMEKLAGRFRAQLMVRSNQRRPLHNMIGSWLTQIEKLKSSRTIRWSLDVDPMDMF